MMYLAESVGCVEPPPLRLGRTVPDEARDIVDDLERYTVCISQKRGLKIRRTIQPLAGANDDPAVGQQTHGRRFEGKSWWTTKGKASLYSMYFGARGGDPGGRREGKEAFCFRAFEDPGALRGGPALGLLTRRHNALLTFIMFVL